MKLTKEESTALSGHSVVSAPRDRGKKDTLQNSHWMQPWVGTGLGGPEVYHF